MSDEKKDINAIEPRTSNGIGDVEEVVYDSKDDFEVFKKNIDGSGVDFRVVSWQKASVIFLKIIFATGVLSIPGSMYSLGAVGGSLSVIGWGALNTYLAIVQGNFRNRHAHCHSIADMAGAAGGGVIGREVVGLLFIIAYVLCTGSGIIGVSVALNALSSHAACTVWWALVATIVVIVAASVRKFQKIGWLTWAGFISIYIAVFIVVVGVTTRDRPALAPQTGDFDLGYHAIAYPTFAVGMVASATIFVSSAGTSAFLPVISEMRNPKEYNKSVYVCMAIVQASYLTFSLVVYKWCGSWVANPSLGSAGETVKKVAFGIGLIGLLVSACLYLHVGAKYVFVRILRNSEHLQKNTMTHWVTWLSCTTILGSLAFILAEAIPIFSFIIALTGSLCFAPLAIALPAWLWLYDRKDYFSKGGIVKKIQFLFHWFLIVLGVFFCIGGTYGVIDQIIAAYASGEIGGAFSCADNSRTTA